MRVIDAGAWGVMLSAVVGCSICASPYDDYYAAYGGLRTRANMVEGRVASLFDPAPEIEHAPADTRDLEQLPSVAPSTEQLAPEALPEGAAEEDELSSVLERFLPDVDQAR
jgi:hypothetical protein